jgi:hypothetical protein
MSTGELRQVNVDGHDALAPFVLEGSSDQITIAPNGARLAYVLQNLDANIWRVPLDINGEKNPHPPEKLFASIREEMDPAYSPDGKFIAFVSNRSGHWNLWMGTRMAPAYVSSRPSRFCRSIPRGLPTAEKSHSTPQHLAKVRSGSSTRAGAALAG